MLELTPESFSTDQRIIKKFLRAKQFYETNIENDNRQTYTRGYILEHENIDTIVKDKSGILINIYFRPAIKVENNKLILYNVLTNSIASGTLAHKILPSYKTISWVYCNNAATDVPIKQRFFKAFDYNTAHYIESQYQSGKKEYTYTINIGTSTVIYKLRALVEPGLFIQERLDGNGGSRYVMRLNTQEAKLLTVKNELRAAFPKNFCLKNLIEVVLNSDINVTEIDKLYHAREYVSVNYSELIDQANMFDHEDGNLNRQEAYYIMEQYNAIDTGLIINLNE
jgi:hypothetical protein